MSDKALTTRLSTIKFLPGCFKTKEICQRPVYRCFFVFDSIPNKFKTQEICNLAVYFFLLQYIVFVNT